MISSCNLDPDVVRWGLHHLDVCTLTNAGSHGNVTKYEADTSQVGYVYEGYHEPTYINVENDAVIARAFQEELTRVAAAEASGVPNPVQASVIAQDWVDAPKRYPSDGCEHGSETAVDAHKNEKETDFDKEGNFGTEKNDEGKNSVTGESSFIEEDLLHSLVITDDASTIDGEVGKRLNLMVPVPHVPKINGDIPSAEEEGSDHQRLLDRLQLYDLIENKVQGDGNCQFRSLSDQLYRSPEHHKFVRQQIVNQLKAHPEMYGGYVPMSYGDYLKKMSKSGEWGDHVTLQAAADWYGVKIFVITSFKDTCYIEILPHVQKSERLICLSLGQKCITIQYIQKEVKLLHP
ncbi:uncharacterized protein LOC110814684 [Carica papaya]|uniref:uncharacterized protein LOC110814684 n=1 Tax=Carica papaya TaxID=3649 RepID=UPI000B8CCF74|nr:uncharacterized protein LOC110814684 [Carica papaya]